MQATRSGAVLIICLGLVTTLTLLATAFLSSMSSQRVGATQLSRATIAESAARAGLAHARHVLHQEAVDQPLITTRTMHGAASRWRTDFVYRDAVASRPDTSEVPLEDYIGIELFEFLWHDYGQARYYQAWQDASGVTDVEGLGDDYYGRDWAEHYRAAYYDLATYDKDMRIITGASTATPFFKTRYAVTIMDVDAALTAQLPDYGSAISSDERALQARTYRNMISSMPSTNYTELHNRGAAAIGLLGSFWNDGTWHGYNVYDHVDDAWRHFLGDGVLHLGRSTGNMEHQLQAGSIRDWHVLMHTWQLSPFTQALEEGVGTAAELRTPWHVNFLTASRRTMDMMLYGLSSEALHYTRGSGFRVSTPQRGGVNLPTTLSSNQIREAHNLTFDTGHVTGFCEDILTAFVSAQRTAGEEALYCWSADDVPPTEGQFYQADVSLGDFRIPWHVPYNGESAYEYYGAVQVVPPHSRSLQWVKTDGFFWDCWAALQFVWEQVQSEPGRVTGLACGEATISANGLAFSDPTPSTRPTPTGVMTNGLTAVEDAFLARLGEQYGIIGGGQLADLASPGGTLAAWYSDPGNLQTAIDAGRVVIAIDPGTGNPYDVMGDAALRSRVAQELAVAQTAAMEQVLNDLRMSLFGSMAQDFNGDGLRSCRIGTPAPFSFTHAGGSIDTSLQHDGLDAQANVSYSGRFFIGKSRRYRVLVRGELLHLLTAKRLAQVSIDCNYVVDPNGDGDLRDSRTVAQTLIYNLEASRARDEEYTSIQ